MGEGADRGEADVSAGSEESVESFEVPFLHCQKCCRPPILLRVPTPQRQLPARTTAL